MTLLNLKSKLLFAIPVITGILAVANITASNLVATTGKDIKDLDRQAQVLESTNASLKQAIGQSSSLTRLQNIAQARGFTVPEHLVYLKAGQPIALRP